jgi:hypothetical protein
MARPLSRLRCRGVFFIGPLMPGDLYVKDVGNIIFNETRALSSSSISGARYCLAHVIINGSQRRGAGRPKTAPPRIRRSPTGPAEATAYADSQGAAEQAYEDNATYGPALGGAIHFNMRPRFSTRPFQGHRYRLIIGPFRDQNPSKSCPSKGCYVNIYE